MSNSKRTEDLLFVVTRSILLLSGQNHDHAIDTDRSIYYGHAYTIKPVKYGGSLKILVTNPWNNGQTSVLTYDQFIEYCDYLYLTHYTYHKSEPTKFFPDPSLYGFNEYTNIKTGIHEDHVFNIYKVSKR